MRECLRGSVGAFVCAACVFEVRERESESMCVKRGKTEGDSRHTYVFARQVIAVVIH